MFKPNIILLVLLLATLAGLTTNADSKIHMEITWYGNTSLGVSEIKLCDITTNTIITIYGDVAYHGHPNPPYGIYKRQWDGHHWKPTQLADLTPYTAGWKPFGRFTAHTNIDFTVRDGYVYFGNKKLCPLDKWNPEPWGYYKNNVEYNWYMVNSTQPGLTGLAPSPLIMLAALIALPIIIIVAAARLL